MEIYALGTEDGTLARFNDRGGGFEEEEGFLGADVVELFDVVAFAYQLDVFLVNLGRRQQRAAGG